MQHVSLTVEVNGPAADVAQSRVVGCMHDVAPHHTPLMPPPAAPGVSPQWLRTLVTQARQHSCRVFQSISKLCRPLPAPENEMSSGVDDALGRQEDVRLSALNLYQHQYLARKNIRRCSQAGRGDKTRPQARDGQIVGAMRQARQLQLGLLNAEP